MQEKAVSPRSHVKDESGVKASRTIYFLAHALLIALGAAATLKGGTFWTSIGTSMIATGAAGAVIYIYLSRSETTANLLGMLSRFGLEQIYDKRAAQIRSEYAVRLGQARSNIDILGFGLSDFRRDYLADLGTLSTKARVRILMLDPESPLSTMRDDEERQTRNTISSQINEFLVQVKQQYPNGFPDRLEIRLYSCIPTVNVFRIDDDLFWGPYFVGRASGNTVTLRVRRGGTMFNQLQDHFDEIWDHFSHPIGWEP